MPTGSFSAMLFFELQRYLYYLTTPNIQPFFILFRIKFVITLQRRINVITLFHLSPASTVPSAVARR